MIQLLLASAVAAPPIDLALGGSAGLADRTQGPRSFYGVRGSFEWPRPIVAPGLTGLVGVDTSGRAVGSLSPTLRLGRPQSSRPHLTAVLGAGASVGPDVALVLSPGFALDLPRRQSGWRLQVAYRFVPTREDWWLELTVARLFRRRSEPKPVWRAEPVCDYVDPNAPSADLLRNRSGATFPNQPTMPQAGVLVVAAYPGDAVSVDGTTVEADANGIAVHKRSGAVRVAILGGGRRIRRDLLVSEDHGLWWSVPPPEPREIGFAQGSAALSSEARTSLTDVARDAGGWRFEIRGGFSPEGDDNANRQLAEARANAVRNHLIESGLDPERLDTVEAPLDLRDAPAEGQRIALVRPLPPRRP
ncbi:MAG: OmpA family protein [Myxococcota bacterium]